MRIESVNKRDSTLFPGAFNTLMEFTQRIGIDLQESALTLDSGFDSQENKVLIKAHGLIPAIYPNRRNMKKPIAIARKFRWFNRETYKARYAVERTFGWQDTYRRLAVSYDRLPEIRTGFRHLAYAMVNFRVTFNGNS